MVKEEMSVGTTIFSFPWTFPSQELVMVVRELHCPDDKSLEIILPSVSSPDEGEPSVVVEVTVAVVTPASPEQKSFPSNEASTTVGSLLPA